MEIKNLSAFYGEKQILNAVDLSVAAGEILCLTGASGAGKTTLLNAVAGLIPYRGEVSGAESLSYVFQTPRLIGDLTVAQNVKLVAAKKSDAEVYAALKTAEIDGKASEKAKFLSGGEKQRVSLARAVLFDAGVFLLDEPFSSLDLTLKKNLLKTVVNIAKSKNKSVIFVTHDIYEIAAAADKLAFLSNGKAECYSFDKNFTEAEKLNKIYGLLSRARSV